MFLKEVFPIVIAEKGNYKNYRREQYIVKYLIQLEIKLPKSLSSSTMVTIKQQNPRTTG